MTKTGASDGEQHEQHEMVRFSASVTRMAAWRSADSLTRMRVIVTLTFTQSVRVCACRCMCVHVCVCMCGYVCGGEGETRTPA